MKKIKTISKFEDLGLSRQLVEPLYELGFEEPTPVQKEAIPLILTGKNLIVQAPTGTGKTMAFALPILERLKKQKNPYAIVIVPTRELCIQVAQEINKVSSDKRAFAVPIYGGQSIENQIRALKKGVQIVVGTPGRLIDHINRKTLNLQEIKCVVLDEADEMLDMGFEEDIKEILNFVPEDCQRLLFSATMPQEIIAISRKYLKDAERISLSRENIIVPNIKQIFYEVRENEKLDVLTKILDTEIEDQVLIFCHTKKETDEVAYALKNRGYSADALHGDYSQAQRERVMGKFRKKDINILVATDVAARGIDISDVSHVINYSIPQNPESYVHRIGRTGRAGREGVAITFVTPHEYRSLREIEKRTKTKILKTEVPEMEELIEIKLKNFLSQIDEMLKKGNKVVETLLSKFPNKTKEDLLRMLSASFLISIGLTDLDDDKRDRSDQNMKKLLVTIGRKDKIEPKDIFKAFIEKAGIKGDDIGRIRISDTTTLVEVKESVAELVINALDKFVLKGVSARVFTAKDKR
ncbi:MAG: DEAD/DEAH box helicase [Proteobacteria bacterium]|nr:DEAD/DEAH box helicase [Pseudomonadota bacterium]